MPLPCSQASSHFPIEPLSASRLLDQELARKERLRRRGNLLTGCSELDDYVLLGGFERGSVVGLSAEDEEVGLSIGLQTVSHLLANNITAKAMVITILPANTLLPELRRALVAQISALPGGLQDLQARVRGCLERTSVARVFDIEGLWEVLAELEETTSLAEAQPSPTVQQKPEPATSNEQAEKVHPRTEISDSEDEDDLSSPEPSPTVEPTAQPDNPLQQTAPKSKDMTPSTLPDLILITHTSALLSALFTGRDRDAAHNMMMLLSSHLNSLTHSPSRDTNGPLVMFLNSTTSPSSSSFPKDSDSSAPYPPRRSGPPKQMESTLRSIFNPPPPPPQVLNGNPQEAYGLASATRNKPSFGLVFSQMLDLHLLCTRVPRTKADVSALTVSPGAVVLDVEFVWVIEVLLDEVGVYERAANGECDWTKRRSREQRWAPVAVDAEGRLVNVSIA